MDWEGSYRKGETPWDLGGPAPPLVALLEGRTVDHRGAGRVLVPGCGAGHDVVAWQEAGMEIVGLDLSPSALAAARERYGEGITGLGRTSSMKHSLHVAMWKCSSSVPSSVRLLLPFGGRMLRRRLVGRCRGAVDRSLFSRSSGAGGWGTQTTLPG